MFKYKEIIFSRQIFDPGELIQIDTEKNLDALLGVSLSTIKNIVVVGAWRGNEVASFLRYPNATIYCFEPNEDNYRHLIDRWRGNKRVICFNVACAAFNGEASLNEASLTGNDSLLPIKNDSKTGLKLVKVHKIKTVRLDDVEELKNKHINLLWADTQGYELEVLSGALELLQRTSSLFLEVYKNNMDYQGGATYASVISFLKEKGFYIVAEGIDKNNIGGNAFFLKNDLKTTAFIQDIYENRIKNSLQEGVRKKYLLTFKPIQLLAVYTPIKLKTFIRKILFKIG
jgi:FkbM family methyltransferase